MATIYNLDVARHMRAVEQAAKMGRMIAQGHPEADLQAAKYDPLAEQQRLLDRLMEASKRLHDTAKGL